jgi:hypothetical protein
LNLRTPANGLCDVENAKSSSTPGAAFGALGPKPENEASNMAPCSDGISVDWAARRLRAAAEFGFNFLACHIISNQASISLNTTHTFTLTRYHIRVLTSAGFFVSEVFFFV